MRFITAVLAILALLALLSAPRAEAPRISFAVPRVPPLQQGPRAERAADDSSSVGRSFSQDETEPAEMDSGEVVIAMKKIAVDHQDREAEPPSRMTEDPVDSGGGGGGVVGASAAAAERVGVATRNAPPTTTSRAAAVAPCSGEAGARPGALDGDGDGHGHGAVHDGEKKNIKDIDSNTQKRKKKNQNVDVAGTLLLLLIVRLLINQSSFTYLSSERATDSPTDFYH